MKLVAVIAVLIVAIAAVSVVLLSNGNDEKPVKETGRLLVYGNANNDDYLDDRDVNFIQNIVDGKIEWNSSTNKFADADTDGKITSKDVELVKKFLNNEQCLMYYQDTWGRASYVHYPITGNIGVMDWRQADLTVSLGIWDRVVACGTPGMNEKKTPGFKEKADASGYGYYVDVETVIKSGKTLGVEVVLAYTGSDGTAEQLQKDLIGSDSKIDLIAVDRTDLRVMAMTTAVLLGCDEAGQKYVEYCDKIIADTEKNLKGIPEDDKKSVVLIQIFRNTDKGNISVMVNSPSPHPLFDILYNYTDTEMITPIEYGSGWYSVTSLEWLLDKDPDYIVFTVASSLWSGNISDEEVQSQFMGYCKDLFGETSAYKNGNIIATDHSCFGGQMCYFAAYTVISEIYPEYVSSEDGDKVYNDWHDAGFALWTLEDLPGQKIRNLKDFQ